MVSSPKCHVKDINLPFQGEDTMNRIVAEIRQEVQDIFQTLTDDASVLISDVESEVSSALASWGQRLLETILSEVADRREPSTVKVLCPCCQKRRSRRFRRRGRTFTTTCGVVRVLRWTYKCQCGHIHVPWEDRQPLKGRYTHKVAAVMMRLAAQLNYRAAAAELKHQGIAVSHTTLHKKVRAWSAGEATSDYVDKQSLESGARWYVSCDGCHTPSLEGWKEVKVGCVSKDYPHTNATSVIKMRPSSPRYIASQSQAMDFGQQLAALATQTGIYQDEKTLDTEEVVVIGDGAAWIWHLAAEQFPNATEVVDYMHAKSHLYEIAKHTFGEENTETVNAWVDTTQPALYNGETAAVVARLRTLATENPTIADVVEREVGYFQKHADRMQYRTLTENGYQIGSGVIESACKHVVAERCKQAGMRWTQSGIDAILFWRCLLKNDAWQPYWHSQAREAA